MPDQINPVAPPGCSYEWAYTSIDDMLVCRRHGFVSREVHLNAEGIEDETQTEPCLAILCEGEFANYVHDFSAVRPRELSWGERREVERIERAPISEFIRDLGYGSDG